MEKRGTLILTLLLCFSFGLPEICSDQHCGTMKAVLLKSFGETEKPALPSDYHILVKVKAAGVNRADTLQRQGGYAPPPGESSIIGEVAEVGPAVTKWKVGDKVMALLAGGGYAEYAPILETHAMLIPAGLSFEEAAALPEAFLTAFQSIFYIGGLKDHQKLLVHAGASGVGTSGIQLATLLNGAEVFVTAGSKDKIDYCVGLGAKGGANYKEAPWLATIKDMSGGVDLVLDCVGQNYFVDNVEILKPDGAPFLDIVDNFIRNTSDDWFFERIHCTYWSKSWTNSKKEVDHSWYYPESQTDLIQKFLEFVKDSFETGKLKPIVSKVFDWNEVGLAHQFMEGNQNTGKIILTGM